MCDPTAPTLKAPSPDPLGAIPAPPPPALPRAPLAMSDPRKVWMGNIPALFDHAQIARILEMYHLFPLDIYLKQRGEKDDLPPWCGLLPSINENCNDFMFALSWCRSHAKMISLSS